MLFVCSRPTHSPTYPPTHTHTHLLRFATGPTDWKFLPKVVPKLQSIHKDGYKIVIFTNQQGITTGKTTKAEFRTKMEAIANKLQLPFYVIAALAKDCYRKPCLGGWDYFIECENGGVEVDKSTSVYVGDAAGREANWRPGGCVHIMAYIGVV